jgi:hypothetical protein
MGGTGKLPWRLSSLSSSVLYCWQVEEATTRGFSFGIQAAGVVMIRRLETFPKRGRPHPLIVSLAVLMVAANESCVALAQVSGRAGSNPLPSRPEEKLITVWKVGDPWRGNTPDVAVPPDLELSAERLGYELKIEAFPASGFAETFFRALEKPDILAIDNYGIIDGVTTPLGSFAGIGSDEKTHQALVRVTESLRSLRGRSGGWEFLIQTSPNYKAARLLALRPPECTTSSQATPLPADLRKAAARIAEAYLEGNPSLKQLEDPDRLHTEATNQEQRRLFETKVCGNWGSDHLTFVQTDSTYESATALGQRSTVLMLREYESQWRLLAASTDPISNTRFVSQIPELVSLITKAWSPGSMPNPAKLLEPQDGHYPTPAGGERFGEFSWQPSGAADVVAEIVEFAYKGDARLIARCFSGHPPTVERLSTGELWHTRSVWKWRVWSIAGTGAMSYSETRSFPN